MGQRRSPAGVRPSRPPKRGGGEVSIDDGGFLDKKLRRKSRERRRNRRLRQEMKKSGVKQVGKTIKKGGGQVSIDDGPMLGGAKPGGGTVSIDDGPMLGKQKVGAARRGERIRRGRGRRRMAGGRPITLGGRMFMGCPDPKMNILMADGSHKKAGDLKIGDLVRTYHEKDLEKIQELALNKSLVLSSGDVEKYSQLREQLENSYAKPALGEYKVEYINTLKNVKKIKLTFDGSEITCSLSHKFYVNNSWKEAKDMSIGDEVSGKKLLLTENVDDGDVMHITIEDAHTYICEGLLSHNKSRMRPEDAERIRRRREESGIVGKKKGGGEVTIDDGSMLKGRNPDSGVRYKQDGTPTAVQQTERVDVQDPTLGGRPEREVPNDRGIARDRLRRRVRERREANRQERSMRREEQRNIKSALASERGIRASERDFTRKRSAMEGG